MKPIFFPKKRERMLGGKVLLCFVTLWMVSQGVLIWVRASDLPCPMYSYTTAEEIIVYVAGLMDIPEDTICYLGEEECHDVSWYDDTGVQNGLETTVLIDNSIFVSKEDRLWIHEFLQDFLADRQGNEKICIVTYGEEVRWLTEYTADYTILKEAVSHITYSEKVSYPAEALLKVFNQTAVSQRKDCFQRVLLITGEVGQSEKEYEKEAFTILAERMSYPVSVLFCSDFLEQESAYPVELFKLIGNTNGKVLGMSEGNQLQIMKELAKDRQLLQFTVKPEESMCNGSRKKLRILCQYQGSTLRMETNVFLPVSFQSDKAKEETSLQTLPDSNEKKDRYEGKNNNQKWWISAILLSGVLFFILFIYLRKRSYKKDFRESSKKQFLEQGYKKMEDNKESLLEDATHMIGNSGRNSGNTRWIWEEKMEFFELKLTDMEHFERSYSVKSKETVVIGRGTKGIDLQIRDDNTVSSIHCEILQNKGCFFVKDLNSSNGTFVNGKRVLLETPIITGMILKLGRLELRVEIRNV